MIFVPIDQLNTYIWIDGEFKKSSEANIHILTHSLHYSGAVFEGERAYNSNVFKLEEHTLRLIESAKALKLKVHFSIDEIMKVHADLLSKNNMQDAYIRPLIFRGSESLGVGADVSHRIMISAVPSSKRATHDFNLHISNWSKPHPNSLPPQAKSAAHYSMAIVSQYEAKEQGFDDAVVLDYRGYIAECTTANLFFVSDNVLITPIADTFLNGITRQTVIKIAKDLGLEVQEKHLLPADILKYDECFITGTAIEVKKINSITFNKQLKKVYEGDEITSIIKEQYDKLVGKIAIVS